MILTAARTVITERGYQAATFQAIAQAAGLSRPTLQYYFTSRAEVYQELVAEASIVVECFIASALRKESLVDRFSAIVTSIRMADFRDRSQLAFLVSARLESTRNPELRARADTRFRDALVSMVDDAKARGELRADVPSAAVVEMMHAMLWGIAFYAGFVDDAADLYPVTKQLKEVFARGLLGAVKAVPAHGDTIDDTPSAVGGRQ